jgi:hypothetical protein
MCCQWMVGSCVAGKGGCGKVQDQPACRYEAEQQGVISNDLHLTCLLAILVLVVRPHLGDQSA